jgi:hypothetical protein
MVIESGIEETRKKTASEKDTVVEMGTECF